MLPLAQLKVPYRDANYYSEGFRNLIENHLPYLRSHVTTKLINLDTHVEYKNQGDFYGLLTDLKINPDLHWITLRLNYLHSPIDYTPYLTHLLEPTTTTLNELVMRYMNTITIR